MVKVKIEIKKVSGRRARARIVVGFMTTYAISAYNYLRCEFESH
jgi:hypothetical protein